MKDAIIEGANERIARALFIAGVYKTSELNNFSMNILPNDVLIVLESQLRSKTEYRDVKDVCTTYKGKEQAFLVPGERKSGR